MNIDEELAELKALKAEVERYKAASVQGHQCGLTWRDASKMDCAVCASDRVRRLDGAEGEEPEEIAFYEVPPQPQTLREKLTLYSYSQSDPCKDCRGRFLCQFHQGVDDGLDAALRIFGSDT